MAPAHELFMSASVTLPLVEDFQRQQKFLAEFVLALAEIGLRRQHADGVVGVGGAAVIGLAAEDREHDRRRHAELLPIAVSGPRYCA